MLHRIASALILSAAFTLSGPALAGDPVGQPGRGGDGHCPIPELVTDPDCVREGAEEYQEQTKSSRNEYPRCRSWEAGSPRPAGCRKAQAALGTLLAGSKSDRDQFPGGRPRQPIHLG